MWRIGGRDIRWQKSMSKRTNLWIAPLNVLSVVALRLAFCLTCGRGSITKAPVLKDARSQRLPARKSVPGKFAKIGAVAEQQLFLHA
jgi:hypothetical protein